MKFADGVVEILETPGILQKQLEKVQNYTINRTWRVTANIKNCVVVTNRKNGNEA